MVKPSLSNNHQRLFANLTPLIPLSFEGEGERQKKRGFTSLGLSLFGLLA